MALLREVRTAVENSFATHSPTDQSWKDLESGLKSLALYEGGEVLLLEALILASSGFREDWTAPRFLGFTVSHMSEASGGEPLSLHGGPQLRQFVEPYLAVQLPLGRDLGTVQMKPEGFADRLLGLLLRADVDFSDSPKFSRLFHVACTDEAQLRSWATPQLLDLLAKNPGIYIEIRRSVMTITTMRLADAEEACQLARLAQRVAELIR